MKLCLKLANGSSKPVLTEIGNFPIMIFLAYNIKIHKGASEFDDIGTKARCWVKAPTIEAADLIARSELNEYNWEILGLQECRQVNENDYVENSTDRHDFNKATEKGILILIDTKPKFK